MSFFADEWGFVVARRGLSAGTLLTPHGPNLVVFPLLVWKLFLKIFGGGSYVPFRLLAAFGVASVGLALGVACRAQWGRWWGLAPVLLFVTLGPAAASLLWPFQIGYTLAVAFGLCGLIALGRGEPRADVIACVSLIISLGSESQGIGFVVGAALVVILSGDWLRRSWTVLVPALLYLLWYATYGHQHSESHLSLWGTSLLYGVQSLSATAGAVVGLSSFSPQTGTLDMTFGVPIAVALIAAIAVAAWRGWRPQPIFWAAAATLLVLWFASSVSNYGAFSRPPNGTRYLLTNAALLFVCVCAALPKPRLAGGGLIAALIVLSIVSATNADQFSLQRSAFVSAAQAQWAELGALDLMRGTVSPTYDPGVVDPNLANIQAAPFFSAKDDFGLKAASVAEIARQPETTRQAVDRILAPNELSLTPAAAAPRSSAARITVLGGNPGRQRGCVVIAAAALDLNLSPGSVTITTSSRYPTTVAAARFATGYGYAVGTVPVGSTWLLHVAADRAPQLPWRVSLTGTGSRVCPVR